MNDFFGREGIYHGVQLDQPTQEPNSPVIPARLKGLFITCPKSIEYLQSHHDILLIDNTFCWNSTDESETELIVFFPLDGERSHVLHP
jgi:hypothetical protein